ncbi:DNA polymerase III subunit delta' [Streptococcus salivarius]|uniref:DNA polymerase III subunit delta' n=1 Tax=Streptococcus salivarius TaxID=1304 RepID=UPI0002250EF0|nr:DNA polymerase III subunit delta' [Streptococcus salivarius]EGX30503.1 DNA polymerase III subunit delta' [Streptococcus salivarius M18]MBZ5845858.1 DNA polymerase III subunit delta' [Streptococcus salivarius]
MKLAESQSKLFEEFSQIIRENRLSHAYLFSGDFGSLDMAIWLAQSRFCVTPENSLPCGHCRPCRLIAQGDFSDVKLVEPQGQIIKTDTIRQLTREFSQSSFEGQAQVFIIRDADKMHVNAANSLLKFIEEPQSQIYIFLLTADDSRMLPTIKSRAQLFYFPKNRVYLEELLQKEGLLLTQAKVLADFAKDDVQALDLAKDNKILDLINTVERFTQSLLSNQDLLYLDVAKLAVQCSEKSEQEMVWAFLTYQLGKDIQNPQSRRWLDLVYEARKMWLANVSFQNAMEYMVLS